MKVHTKYDLKGSVVHRTAKEGERVLKDNNIRENETRVHLGHQRAAFLKVKFVYNISNISFVPRSLLTSVITKTFY